MKFNLIDTLKGITAGTFNSLVLNKQVEEVAEERMSICRECPWFSENRRKAGEKFLRKDEFCTNCGCNLHLKTRYMAAECPLDPPKWSALVDQLKGNEIDDIVNKTKDANN